MYRKCYTCGGNGVVSCQDADVVCVSCSANGKFYEPNCNIPGSDVCNAPNCIDCPHNIGEKTTAVLIVREEKVGKNVTVTDVNIIEQQDNSQTD